MPILRFRNRRVIRRRDSERERLSCVHRVQDAIVPEPGGGVVGRPFAFVLVEDRTADGLLLFGAERLALARELVALHGGQHASGLLSTHDRDAGIGPHPEKARIVRASAHSVVAGAERAANDDSKFRDDRVGDGVHHLRPVLRDAASFVLPPDDEAGDVLEEDKRDAALIAQLDEVRRLERRLGKQHTVVGDDADEKAMQPGEASDERRARSVA